MPNNTHFIPLQLLFSCTQKPYAKTPQKTHKNPAKNPNGSGKNLLHRQKLLQSFNKILAKNFKRYPKNY
jgi:hypothetical protein